MDTEELLPLGEFSEEIRSDIDGVVAKVQADVIGHTALDLGAGRATKDEAIDPGSGVFVYKKVGDPVKKGEILAKIYSGSKEKLFAAEKECREAFLIN